jgi:hypothetical protein
MQKSSIITTVVIILIVGALYYFFAPDSWKFWGQTAQVIDTVQEEPQHETVNAKHQFFAKDKTHIVAGEANSPTACDLLTTNTQTVDGNPQVVTINFTSKTGGEKCPPQTTSNRFKVEFKADENAVIKATWNGQPVEINLIPADPNENLLNFDIFLKG